VDDSEHKDNARTKNHENFCDQDAPPVLCQGELYQPITPIL
jgi:hypothetical protein